MITWLKDFSNFTLGPTGTNGETVTECLGHCYDIRNDIGVLKSEPFAGTRETGLYLIDHHQHAALVAQLTNTLQILT